MSDAPAEFLKEAVLFLHNVQKFPLDSKHQNILSASINSALSQVRAAAFMALLRALPDFFHACYAGWKSFWLWVADRGASLWNTSQSMASQF